MRWLLRFFPTDSPGDSLLTSVRLLAKSVGAEARNPKWTSHGDLELDIFCQTEVDFGTFLAAVEPVAKAEFVTDLNRAPEHLADDEILSKAKGLFNAERYWECHEVLEGLWRQKQREEKRLLQGMILVCAAFVHHQKGEDGVAMGVMRRAIPQLEYPSLSYREIRVATLRENAQSVLESGRFSNFLV